MRTIIIQASISLIFVWSHVQGQGNSRPIIGVLAQKPPSSLSTIAPGSESYIAASYIKWVESAGGRAVPIMINRNDSYYEEIFNSVNGILFPGGATGLVTSGYGKAGLLLYNMAKQANQNGDYFPLWGTCLGFELMSYMAVEKLWLTECDSYDEALHLGVLPEALDSRLLSAASVEVLDILMNEDVTSNFHHKCLTIQNLTLSGLDQHFRVLALNEDSNGLEFIAAWESISEPFYGTQFHPEKNIFEWTTKYTSIPHSPNAVKSGLFFAQFFLDEARKNNHQFPSLAAEQAKLIYNFPTTYTGSRNSTFQEAYFFYPESKRAKRIRQY